MSVGYVVSSPFTPYPLSPLIKILPIIALGVVAHLNLPRRLRSLALYALLFSGIGDLLLAHQFYASFVFGLASFLLAHLFYAVAYYRLGNDQMKRPKNLLTAAILLYSVILLQFVLPKAAELTLAVSIYTIVITGASCMAVKTLAPRQYFIAAGAFIFVISDSIIAWNMFVDSIVLVDVWVMSTYYTAQLLIVYGLINSSTNTPSVSPPES